MDRWEIEIVTIMIIRVNNKMVATRYVFILKYDVMKSSVYGYIWEKQEEEEPHQFIDQISL